MDKLPSGLRKLDAALEALAGAADPMVLSQLDGYLAGVMVCPDLIMPSEWLPLIWGKAEDGEEPVFEGEEQLKTTIDLIMKHYNAIGRDLARNNGRYVPIYDVQTETGEVVPEFWLIGFSEAVSLRPESWLEIAEGDDEDAATALAILLALAATDDEETLPKAEREELATRAPDMIPYCVEQLNTWRLRRDAKSTPATPKVGRNDPCPCGSGKKYKKCCGLN